MNTKPQIVILCSNKIKKEKINEILYGIEEEGLPYYLEFLEDSFITKEKLTSGMLEVGIQITSDGFALLTSRKYDKQFIQKEHLDSNHLNLRNMGSNSARLVKKKCLK